MIWGCNRSFPKEDTYIVVIDILVGHARLVQVLEGGVQLLKDFLQLIAGEKLLQNAPLQREVGVPAGNSKLLDHDGLYLLHALDSLDFRQGLHLPEEVHGREFHPFHHQATASVGKQLWFPIEATA